MADLNLGTSAEFTPQVLEYLAGQPLGRLATVDAAGAPQNSPVGFSYNPELGTIDIGGMNMAASRKYRNIAANPNVAFVVDDVVSTRPWSVRCVEIRGVAEQAHRDPSHDGRPEPAGDEIIRIYPRRVISFEYTAGG